MPILPIPAAAKYNKTGEPNPPAPTTRTEEDLIFFCPNSPTCGKIRCLAYLAFSSLVKVISDIFPLNVDLQAIFQHQLPPGNPFQQQ